MSVLRILLTLLHPYCPFVTEELWEQVKPQGAGMLIREPWPIVDKKLKDQTSFDQLQVVIDIITAIRKIRAEQGIAPDKKVHVMVVPGKYASVLKSQESYIVRLGRIDTLEFTQKPSGDVASVFLTNGIEVHVLLEGLIDLEGLKKEQTQLTSYVQTLRNKLDNEQFTSKAPAAVIEQERQKLVEAEGRLKGIDKRLK